MSRANGLHQEFSDADDGAIVTEKPKENAPALLYIEDNVEERYFSVTAYDSDRNLVGLLVNNTPPSP